LPRVRQKLVRQGWPSANAVGGTTDSDGPVCVVTLGRPAWRQTERSRQYAAARLQRQLDGYQGTAGNQSLLAHGAAPIREPTAKALLGHVQSLAAEVYGDELAACLGRTCSVQLRVC